MLVPNTQQGCVNFYKDEVTGYWTPNAAAIGLSPGDLTSINAKITAAETAITNAFAAKQESKNKTMILQNAIEELREVGASLIAVIRGKALQTGDFTIYTKANIPPPTQGTAQGPAAQPTNVGAFIDNLGNVQLSWQGSLAGGTFFTVWRKLSGETSWTQMGSVVSKSFADSTIPGGTSSANYYVVATRSGGSSPASEPITVLFGSQSMAA